VGGAAAGAKEGGDPPRAGTKTFPRSRLGILASPALFLRLIPVPPARGNISPSSSTPRVLTRCGWRWWEGRGRTAWGSSRDCRGSLHAHGAHRWCPTPPPRSAWEASGIFRHFPFLRRRRPAHSAPRDLLVPRFHNPGPSRSPDASSCPSTISGLSHWQAARSPAKSTGNRQCKRLYSARRAASAPTIDVRRRHPPRSRGGRIWPRLQRSRARRHHPIPSSI